MKRSKLFTLVLFICQFNPLAAAPNDHAGDNDFWAQAAALLPNHAPVATPSVSTRAGRWGSVLSWPHVPVTIAVLPNGKLLTYSGQEPKHWPGTAHRTHWALWDPSNGTFSNDIHQNHEMFCAHPVMRTDGNVQTMGGRYTIEHSSVYDWKANRWTKVSDMNGRRWYTTSVALPDGDVATFGGSGSPNTAERYDHNANRWNLLGGINWQPVSTSPGFEADGWPFLMVAPDGRLFHFGPTDQMHWVDASGSGSRTSAGITVPGNHYPHDGGMVMIDSGKYLIVGGAASASSTTAGKFCYLVDLNTTPPTVSQTGQLNYARSHLNIVALPSGEVVAFGGNTTGARFSDGGSILPAEVWNPATGTWRQLASMAIPRNYHSTAALLPDGRIFTGGGGYEVSNPNASFTHADAQIFTPPALLDSNNNPLTRPNISSAPTSVQVGSVFNVTANAGIRRFTLIRMMAITHGVSTDQRVLTLPFAETSAGNYQLIGHPNHNVMVPGYWMLYATNANGVYSEAKIIQIKELADPAPLANEALICGDDRHELFINGKLVSIGTNWNEAVRTAFAANPSTTVAIRVVNAAGSGGLIGQLDLNGKTILTGSDWKVSTNAPTGWQLPSFNDSTWQKATLYNRANPAGWPAGSAAKWIWTNDAENHNVAYFRYVAGQLSLADINPTPVQVNSPYSLPLVATGGLAPYTFTQTGLPAGLTLNATTGHISGTVAPSSIGQHPVNITVSDSAGKSVSRSFNLEVINETSLTFDFNANASGFTYADDAFRNTNNANYASGSHSTTAGLNGSGALCVTLGGIDNSQVLNMSGGWTYLFNLASARPVRIRFDYLLSQSETYENDEYSEALFSLNGNLIGSQANSTTIDLLYGDGQTNGSSPSTGWRSAEFHFGTLPAGTHRITFGAFNNKKTLNDEITTACYDNIRLTLGTPSNSAPILKSLANQAHSVGTNISLSATANDPENDSLTYSATSLPTGLILSQTGSISGTLQSAGTYPVTITVTDPLGLADTASFTWTVNPALTLPPQITTPSLNGSDATITINSVGGTNPTFRWNFGDGSPEVSTSSSTVNHRYNAPGRYLITLTATDANGTSVSTNFLKLVTPALTSARPINSQPIITTGTPGNSRLWNVNPDQNTVTVFNAQLRLKLAEISVGKTPRAIAQAPNSSIWVVNKEDATLSIINPTTNLVTNSIALPRGSRPHGLVFAPNGSTAWLALEGTGELAKLNPSTGNIVTRIPVGSSPRHLAINHDGSRVYVSRFITPPVPGEDTAKPVLTNAGGLVVELNASTNAIIKTILLKPSTEPDSGGSARGLPNYLGAPALSPANDFAWIPSKQDNIQRGALRDGLQLDHDKTLRAISSRIRLSDGLEVAASRVDHDNASMPSAALFDHDGLHVFVALEGSRQIAVIDAYGEAELFRFPTERAPQGLTLSPDGQTLYVYNYMSRSISVYDVSSLVRNGLLTAPLSATLDPTASETLPAKVLLGKQHFYDAFDDRLSREDYVSCAACHSEDGHDGRVWDFTGFGEGLRNTIDLRGRGSEDHGPFHWTANFDEIQDFEGQIRGMASGTGLISNGSPHPPLGLPNGGRSADLDALASYLASLTSAPDSPHRKADGTLTSAALDGQLLFVNKGCVDCHSGPAFTDSGTAFHDIGTLTAASGQRLGGSLLGLDTPSLLTVFDGAPYLHDGSAATIEEAIAAHFDINTTAADRTNLAAFLKSLDSSSSTVINRPPVLSAIANQSGVVGNAVSLQAVASDPESQALTFSATGLPSGLSLNATSGLITGTLTAAGTFNVNLSVSDKSNSSSRSFTWIVTEAPTGSLAFSGTPNPITSRIEAEKYDTGGPGVSYSDTTPENYGANFGPNFRDEGVDLELSYDTDATPSIGWMEPGEWTTYTVQLVPGTYDLAIRAASAFSNPGSVEVLLDNVLLGTIDITSTGGWYVWQDFTLPNITITASSKAVLRLNFLGESFNTNYFEFRTPGGGGAGGGNDPTQSPYNGIAAAIPGRIQAENFDEGGSGVAYLDTEAENFGLTYTGLNYRSSSVDIEPSFDSDASPSLGWVGAGEWLEYTVNIKAGTYDLKARISSGFALPGGLRVELDGVILGEFDVPGTGDWYNWQTLTLPSIKFSNNGTHVLRLLMTREAGFNLNWIEFGDNTTPPQPTGQSPFGGTAHLIPGLIEAENYDLGGQGVAYFDAEPANLGGSYRTDGVDIEPAGDTGGGLSVGWFDNAQWMEYTIAATPGIYTMSLRASSGEAIVGDVRVTLDGTELGIFAVESTGGWTSWQTFTLPNIAINTGGEKVLRLEMIGDAVNINWFSFLQTASATNLVFSTLQQTGDTQSADSDSDGDAQSNLAEFAFGSDAGLTSSRPLLPVGYDREGNCCQSVPVALGGSISGNTYTAAGLRYHFQGSLDLESWKEAITFLPNPSDLPAPPAGYQYLTFRLTDSSSGSGFLRVFVEELP